MGLESSSDFRSAGVARYAFGLLDALSKPEFSHHEFHFFLLPSFAPPPSWISASHVFLHRTWTRYNRWTLLASGLAASRFRLDFLLTTANAVPLISPVPTGVFIHDLFPLDHPEWFPDATASVNAKTIPAAVERSRLILVNSVATQKDLVRHFPHAEGKSAVTPLAAGNSLEALPIENRSVLRQMGIIFPRFLLTLSTIEPRKNLGKLLEAMAQVNRQPELQGVGLVIAGSKGWKYESALERVTQLGLEDRVLLLGYVESARLPLLFNSCELYICPSISEGFGMPLVEAMGAGAPVLSSSGGALPEVGGDAVRYFDPMSVDSMAQCISQALARPSERDHWVEAGRRQAERFTWAKTASETLAQIARVLP